MHPAILRAFTRYRLPSSVNISGINNHIGNQIIHPFPGITLQIACREKKNQATAQEKNAKASRAIMTYTADSKTNPPIILIVDY
ncbi:hypothetical protein G4Y73_13155 [Wenzhouxiangella sp. XN201]|nr:hypothetical protein [Wenzhouxiangella sp. XN201]